MNRYFNLYIIGTSHISRQSIAEIEHAFKTLQPEIVAVELDKSRATSLLSAQKSKFSITDIRKVGFKGFFFALLGSWASKKLGKLVGVTPGAEMKAALQLANKQNSKVAFIDQHIEITLKRLSKFLTWKERWHFLGDIFKGLFLRKRDPLLNFDISKVPDRKLIRALISKVKERYPNIYKVLIEERNYFMARRLKKLMTEHPDKKILAIVGAGHEEDIISVLRDNEGITYSFHVS